MNRLLIATSNPAKLAEYRGLLRGLPLEAVSLRSVGAIEPPAETGSTFTENALLKGRYYFAATGLPTLADDGGLEIDALGGAPGVRSHRWAGGDATDQQLVDEVMRRTRHLDDAERRARLRSAMALVFSDGATVVEHVGEASIEGIIARAPCPRMRQGFPYRAVLYLPDRRCFLAELSEEEEARLSQRRITVERARPIFERIAELPPPVAPR